MSEPTQSPHPARVLVVDDDRAVTRILRSMLQVDGHIVEEVNTGIGLAERIRDTPPDLVLLDVHMPGVGGLDVLAELGEAGARRVPVVMLTGESENVALAVDTLRRGAIDYLVKPVALDRLLQTVRATLRLHRLRSELDRALLDRSRAIDGETTARREVARLEALLRTRTEQLRAVLEALDAAALLVDHQGAIRASNRAAADLLGVTPRGVVGQGVEELLELPAGDRLAGVCEVTLRADGTPVQLLVEDRGGVDGWRILLLEADPSRAPRTPAPA